jgi:hypothetical protein
VVVAVVATLDDVYGTRPDRLPPRLLRAARADPSGDRRVSWVTRPGVKLLDVEQHLRYERESLGSLPRHPDGTLDLDAAGDESVLLSAYSESVDLGSVIQAYVTPGGDVVFFWDSPAVPSLRTSAELAVRWLPEITREFAEFWLFAPDDRILLESSVSGLVTVARVPPAADRQGG